MKIAYTDIETTGLHPQRDEILEIAVAMADFHRPFLTTDSQSWVIPLSPSERDALYAKSDDTVKAMHTANGLWEECVSQWYARMAKIENPATDWDAAALVVQEIKDTLAKWWAVSEEESVCHIGLGIGIQDVCRYCQSVEPKHMCEAAMKQHRTVIGGSSAHFDLGFLRVHLPETAALLSHRVYDVSALKLYCESVGMPKIPKEPGGETAHRAIADIQASIRHALICDEWLRDRSRLTLSGAYGKP